MTIERLQELLVIIENGAFEYSEEDYTAEQLDKAMDDIIHLINVEIWRMNLIEEDVKEAIETMKCIYPSRKEIMSGEYPEVAEAIDIAIQALKAYRPSGQSNQDTADEGIPAVRKNRTTARTAGRS